MLMVKEALFYSAIAMVAFFCMQLFAGKLTDVQAECRESQFCGGYCHRFLLGMMSLIHGKNSMAMTVKNRKKLKKLTPEQKKAVWAKTQKNAGAGWESKYKLRATDPRAFENGSKEWEF